MPRDALMRLLPTTVGTRLQRAGSNRWTSETCLTPTNLSNEWQAIVMSTSGVSQLGVAHVDDRHSASTNEGGDLNAPQEGGSPIHVST